MWILMITITIGGFLLFIFSECKKVSKDLQSWLSYGVYAIVVAISVAVLLNHSDFITSTIEAYQYGRIVKHETITIEGTDTVKVIKYKYK